jgi:hypothetical protein
MNELANHSQKEWAKPWAEPFTGREALLSDGNNRSSSYLSFQRPIPVSPVVFRSKPQ